MNIKKTTFYKKAKRALFYALLGFIGASVLIVALFGFIPHSSSAFMLQQHLTDYNQNKDFKANIQTWKNKHSISPHIFSAVVAAEDQLFYQHFGFDLTAISHAIKDSFAGRKLRGASTISQQVAKNVFLSPARSLLRKALEAWFTLLIELLWSKDRILLVYVNIAEFGDHLYGIEAASQHYFSRSAKNINPKQAALLAASLPNPALFKVDKPSNKMIDKQRWILQQMKNLNYL